MADAIEPPSFMKLRTKRGLRPEPRPSMSCSTSTWPDVPPPAPMPMVISSGFSAVISVASAAGTISNTIIAAPASASSRASRRSTAPLSPSRPCTR